MDLRKLYDNIIELQTTLEQDHDDPDLHIPDYHKVKALAATYELQEYLSNVIAVAEVTGKLKSEKENAPEDEEEEGFSPEPYVHSYVSDTKVLWQSAVVEGSDSDIILLQHGDGRYGFDVNVGHEFNSRQDEIKYMQDVLSAFTAWMKEHGYATDRTLPYDETFVVDFTYNSLQSVEEVYCMFKMAVMGFCNA